MQTHSLLTVKEIWKLLYNYNKWVCCRSITYLVSALLVVLPSYCIIDGMQYTGLFISPSRISELDCATTKTDTAERNLSIGRESLQVFFVLGALPYHQVPPLGGSREETNRTPGPIGPDGLFVSQSTGSHSAGIHVPFTNCFVCRWFCVVHDPKPPLHSHNWCSFGKFQDTERFLIHCERHFSSRLTPSGGTWKYAKAPRTKKTWRGSLPIDMLLSAVSVLFVAQSSSEIPEGLMNNPVFSWFYL